MLQLSDLLGRGGPMINLCCLDSSKEPNLHTGLSDCDYLICFANELEEREFRQGIRFAPEDYARIKAIGKHPEEVAENILRGGNAGETSTESAGRQSGEMGIQRQLGAIEQRGASAEIQHKPGRADLKVAEPVCPRPSISTMCGRKPKPSAEEKMLRVLSTLSMCKDDGLSAESAKDKDALREKLQYICMQQLFGESARWKIWSLKLSARGVLVSYYDIRDASQIGTIFVANVGLRFTIQVTPKAKTETYEIDYANACSTGGHSSNMTVSLRKDGQTVVNLSGSSFD